MDPNVLKRAETLSGRVTQVVWVMRRMNENPLKHEGWLGELWWVTVPPTALNTGQELFLYACFPLPFVRSPNWGGCCWLTVGIDLMWDTARWDVQAIDGVMASPRAGKSALPLCSLFRSLPWYHRDWIDWLLSSYFILRKKSRSGMFPVNSFESLQIIWSPAVTPALCDLVCHPQQLFRDVFSRCSGRLLK